MDTNPGFSLINRIKQALPSHKKKLIPLIVIAIAIPVTLVLVQTQQELRKRASEPQSSSVLALSNELLQEGTTDVSTNRVGEESVSQSNTTEVVNIAKQRKEAMLKLAKEKPEDFLVYALPQNVTKELNPLAQEYVEKEVEVQGKLKVIHFDDFKNKKDKFEYKLEVPKTDRTPAKTYNINFADSPTSLTTDSTIKVEGYSLENELVTQGGGSGITPIAPAKLSPLGEQKTLVIMFNFQDDLREPVSKEKVTEILFGQTNSFNSHIKENSYNKTNFTGDVVGYYKIPFSNMDCNYYSSWADAAKAVAFANGVDINSYPRLIYVFPSHGNCWAPAWATIGGNPSESWMVDVTNVGIYAHEIGHNLGSAHANSFDCGELSIKDFDQWGYAEGCTSMEYGDPTDVMGYTAWDHIFQYNGPHKEEVEFLDPSQIQTVNENATVTINTLEDSSSGLKLVRIPVPNANMEYHVSYRQPINSDEALPTGMTQGASIHLWSGKSDDLYSASSPTQLIDTTPGSPEYFNDAALVDNREFNDPGDGISIKQISHNPSSATVEIKVDKSICRRQTPEISVDQISQTGVPDQELTYNVTVKNTDTPTCSAAEFNLDTYYSYGTWIINSDLPGTLSPGQSVTVPVKIKPNGSNPIGLYVFSSNLNSQYPRHKTSVKYNYIVFGTLENVNVSPGEVEVSVGQRPVGISALAYDNLFNPIRGGVSYEWSMSSSDSIGKLSHTNGPTTTFIPEKAGFGEITVKALFNGDTIMKTIPARVLAPLSPIPTTQTLNLNPTADAFVRSSSPNTNFGNNRLLSTDSNPNEISYLKFNLKSLAGKTIVKVTLSLKVSQASNAEQVLRLADDKAWSEGGLKYSNRPSFSSLVTTFSAKPLNKVITLDVKAPVNKKKGGVMTLGITSNGSSKASYYSSEAVLRNKPQLLVEYR